MPYISVLYAYMIVNVSTFIGVRYHTLSHKMKILIVRYELIDDNDANDRYLENNFKDNNDSNLI